MSIVHFHRKPYGSNYSIEMVFDALRAVPAFEGVKVHVCRFDSRGVLKRLYNMVEAALNQGDVNHITGDVSYLALLFTKKRTILTVHDCRSMLRLHGIRRHIFRWLWIRMPVKHCAVVTAISQQTRQEVLRYSGCDESKVRVIPNPVGSAFTYVPRVFDREKPVILQVGTGSNKNLSRVVEALAGIACRLQIIGRVSDDVKKSLTDSGVQYAWAANLSREEVSRKYIDADLVVFCSTYEGFGMPIIEANATGRPVVTSDLEPMKSVAGGAACLVDPFDVGSIRAGITKVIQDGAYREDLVRRGLENAKRYSAKTIAASYQAIYDEVLEAASGIRAATHGRPGSEPECEPGAVSRR